MKNKMAIYSYLDVLTAVILMFIASAVYGQDCPALQKEPWSYQGENGPASWGSTYPECNEKYQSPIRISEPKISYRFEGLTLYYYHKPISKAKVTNTGYTIKVTPYDGTERSFFLQQDFILTEIYFHWGDTSDRGSEHIINNTQYAMEMQLVHISETNVTSIISILFNEEDDDNDDLQPLIDVLSDVQYKDDESDLKSSFSLDFVQDDLKDFVTFQGTRTIPPCDKNVNWFVKPHPYRVGTAQMNQFRQLYAVKEEDTEDSCKLVNNFRPVQPLDGRSVVKPDPEI